MRTRSGIQLWIQTRRPESDLEKETATASNGKEIPETKRKMAKRAMNAEPVTGGTYSISQTDGKFQVVAEA